jgi:deoxycytidylate deaminase
VTQLLAYLPVIHAGYHRFLAEHGRDAELLLVGLGFAADYPVLRKEIRALDPQAALHYLLSSGVVPSGRVVEPADLPDAVGTGVLLAPDEDVTRGIVRQYGLADRAEVRFLRAFLRWDREWSKSGRPSGYDGKVRGDDYARRMQELARKASDRSSDWWRQVGALAVRDGRIVVEAHNRHMPSEYSPYVDGDPRNNFQRGQRAELTTALHAEAAIVGWAAREGVSLRGAELHVTTFPCPTCARLVAEAGFARCYFSGPYSVLDGENVLRQAGVELWFVDMESPAGLELSLSRTGV